MRKFLDSHCHMMNEQRPLDHFLSGLDEAGTDSALVISFPPKSWGEKNESPDTGKGRLDLVMDYAKNSNRVYPFYWVDPMEEDALEQVDMAVKAGVCGFKAICTHYYAGDKRPMEVWNRIAENGKPILFHSGILYGTKPSSTYNRPANFEYLYDIPNLRFAMAHVSWPWCDECLAVFGYWCSRRARGLTTAELFLDTTPGTPGIYREEVLTKLYTIGYPIENNVMLGIDNRVHYDAERAKMVVQRDEAIFDKLGLTEDMRNKYFYENALRFVGGPRK